MLSILWSESARFALALSGFAVIQKLSRRNGGGKKIRCQFRPEKRSALRAVLGAKISGYLLDKTFSGW